MYQLLRDSDAQVYNVRVADILVNKDVKQFKSDADPVTGEVAGRELHGEFQKIPAKPIVVLQKRDGSLEVVTGRHRLGLAKRNGLETIPANIIKEADGWTPESAALLDAFDNILDEKGSYADYVPFFRKAGIPREVAEAYGLLARPKGRLSFEIAMNGTDDLVSFVAAGDKRVTPDVAAAICRAVPVPAAAREAGALTGQAARHDAIQHYVIRAVIDEGLRADQAEIMANGIRAEYAKRAEAKNVQQDDLFGFDETFNTEMALRAKYAGDQIARINLDLRALKIVSGKQSGNVAAKDSLLKKYNIKGPDDAAGIERAIQELETLHHRWQHYYTDPDLAKEADAFVKKSLRLDPEDQPPVPLDPKGNPITPESQGSGAAPHQDANQPISESANQPAAPAASLGSPAAQTSGEAANVPTQSLPEIPHGINDEQANGPRFAPLAKGDNFQEIEKTTRERKKNEEIAHNDFLGNDSVIGNSRDISKIATFVESGEDIRAHQYAAKNIIPLTERARVAVRQNNYKTSGLGSGPKTFTRLFAPFLFEGRLYVAVVTQYKPVKEKRVNGKTVDGIHAVRVTDVIRADRALEVTSRDPKGDNVTTRGQSALDTITIPNEGPNDNTLSLKTIQYVIDNPKKGGNQRPRLLDPDGNGGLIETPCTAQDVADRIVADVADFVGRARYRADHKLQPIDTDDGGRFTMGEGVTVTLSDGVAAVAGLAAKSPAEAAKLLDAIQTQLPPGVALAVTDRLAPDVQNLIQAHNENALTYRIWEAIDKYAKIDYRFEDGKHILTFPEKDTRTYQENADIVKAVKALLPEGTPLTLENTKSRMLQALAAHTPTTDAQPTPVARQGVPESPASPESPVRPSGVEDAELPDTPQAQRDAVRNLHQGRNTWLKAPNGKRTKLPQKLWVDVRTPNFKRFFGDWENHPETIHPKLLDENGEPRIFWHNSPAAGIRVFDPTRSRAAMDIQGTYFSPDKIDAAGYGQHAYPVFIALKRPADQATAYAGFTPGSTADAGAIRAQELRDQGYDGVIVEDGDAPSGIAEIIVLDPNAIKSAGRNAGAYDPSNPDILANQAPTAQAPGAQPPANPGAAQPDARSPGDPFSVLRSPFSVNGVSAIDLAVYPNGGRVPVAGSPAATAGTLPLSLPHAVQLFHLLTGKLPGVVAQKNRGPRNALGWFLPKTGDAFVRAQLFGLIDQSDLTVLKDGLAKRGYFRHEDPAWCVTQTKDSIRREKALSNQKLAAAADLLIRRRTRAGVHQGAAAKVMAHELWHAISASGGVPPRDHGNLLGQIYNLKKCMANALPEAAFATDDALRQEAKEFIIWWRGLGTHEPYFDQPHEAYAEMGAAFFLAPEAVKEQAPIYYDAMLDGLRNYPQAFDALAAIRDQRAAGGDLDAFQQRLLTTWQAAHEARVRKLRDEVGKPTEDERKARIVQLLWNRYAPVMLILQRAQKDVRARLRQDLKDGNITQADHDAKIKELDEDLLDLRHHTLLFTHRHGPSKLFLADIWGTIAQKAEELDVSMNDLNIYLHLRRVEELEGRATALGIDPPTARAMLNQFFKRLGYAKVRAIARLAKTFHAIWQHSILENPDVIAMLGPDKIAELKQNAHYITMRHVPTPEELQAATVAWEKTKRAKSGGDPLNPIVRELLGHKAYTSGVYGADAHTGVASALKRLQGSLRQTESPLTATAETGLAILEAAQRNALTVSLVRALKAVGFDEIAVLKPTDDVITNDRIGTVQYMENGKRVTLAAPRSVVDALSGAPHEIPYLTAATRFLSAGFTTNNPAFIIPAALRDLDSLYVQMPGMKRGFAQWCAAYANLIPGVGPLRHARAAVNLGNWVNWSAQFIPPHVMKRISQTPIGRLLYGQNTVAYWTSVGAKIARIIQHMDFEGTLRQAHEARLAGDNDKAEALEYCATMARHALEDGVLLTYNQQLADDYLKGGLQRLFDKYHLKYDDDRRHLPIPAKIAKRAQDYRDTLRQRLQRANAIKDPKRRIAALAALAASPAVDLPRSLFEGLWNSTGFLSEYQSMMVKLAGWAYLHHESAAGTLPKLPTDPAGNAAPQGATPVARQGAPFSVPRSPFSGGGADAAAPRLPLSARHRRRDHLAAGHRGLQGERQRGHHPGGERRGLRRRPRRPHRDPRLPRQRPRGHPRRPRRGRRLGPRRLRQLHRRPLRHARIQRRDRDPRGHHRRQRRRPRQDRPHPQGRLQPRPHRRQPGHHEGRSRPRRRLRGAHLHLLLPRHRGRARRDPPRLHLHHHFQHPQRILQGRLHRGRRRRRRRLPPRLRRSLRQRRQRPHRDGDRRRRHHPHLHRRPPRRGLPRHHHRRGVSATGAHGERKTENGTP